MQKLTEIYMIQSDGRREYFEPFTSLHIIIRCPNRRIQNIIDATRAHNCSYKIIARIPAQNQSTHQHYRTAGTELRIYGQARFIFALLDAVSIHQHYGHTYTANASDWRYMAPAPHYTHRAYRLDASGVLRSKIIERHNIKQFRANGWHIVEI